MTDDLPPWLFPGETWKERKRKIMDKHKHGSPVNPFCCEVSRSYNRAKE